MPALTIPSHLACRRRSPCSAMRPLPCGKWHSPGAGSSARPGIGRLNSRKFSYIFGICDAPTNAARLLLRLRYQPGKGGDISDSSTFLHIPPHPENFLEEPEKARRAHPPQSNRLLTLASSLMRLMASPRAGDAQRADLVATRTASVALDRVGDHHFAEGAGRDAADGAAGEHAVGDIGLDGLRARVHQRHAGVAPWCRRCRRCRRPGCRYGP